MIVNGCQRASDTSSCLRVCVCACAYVCVCACVSVSASASASASASCVLTCKRCSRPASVEARCRTAGVVKTILVQDGEEVWELQPLMIVTKKT